MSGVSGDFSKLQVILQRISPARLEAVKRSLSVNLAEEALTQIKLGFEQGRAPDGTPWKPLAQKRSRDAKGSKGIPLNDTGQLKNAWTRILTPGGFIWQNTTVYAAAHQYGAQIRHGARTNIHAGNGKFQSRARAAKKKGSSRVSFSGAHVQNLPARPMVPVGALPVRWQRAFESVVKSTLLGYGMG